MSLRSRVVLLLLLMLAIILGLGSVGDDIVLHLRLALKGMFEGRRCLKSRLGTADRHRFGNVSAGVFDKTALG